MIESKSIAKGIFQVYEVEEGFDLLMKPNKTKEDLQIKREIGKESLQFHFCLTKKVVFFFNGGNYKLELKKDESLVLYNPKEKLPIDALLEAGGCVISLIIPIEKLHTFFSKEAHFIAFLNEENRDKKYYQKKPVSPGVITILNQIIKRKPNKTVAPLYYKAKALELLSLYFNSPRDIDLNKCPFLADEKNVEKIKRAKEIVIEELTDPPTLQEIAYEIQLPLNRLKSGFKQVYGNTVFGFLLEYKMEKARQLLLEGSLNVNEVGLKLGYSASSHFISAFKRKYGTTPKRYIMAVAGK